jgi:hypothetical protein
MRLLAVSVFALVVLSTSVCVAPARSDAGPKFEARIRKALEAKDPAELRSLAAEYRKLSAQARRDMPLRVRDDSVEFNFRGEFAGDKFRPGMLEYLVSGSAKDYESLLVVSEGELERVQALRTFFEKREGKGRHKWWSAQLIWVESETPQAIDLEDLLLHLKPSDRVQFLDRIGITDAGLGGTTNVNADSGLLPRKQVPARLLLTIRMLTEP